MKEFIEDKRVAFVALGPSILNKGLGEYIDSFDTVIRTNYFPIEECYRKDYGSKCDLLYTIDSSYIKQNLLIEGIIHSKENIKKYSEYKYFFLDKESLLKDAKIILDLNYGELTSGVSIITEVLHYRPKQIMAFGMTGYQNKDTKEILNYQDIDHYIKAVPIDVNKVVSLNTYTGHRYKEQNLYIRYLIEKGILHMDEYSKEYFV